MDSIFSETAIESLTHLESYYQSKYEHYLAMATEAKENKERVELLLLDLGRDASYLQHQKVVESKHTQPQSTYVPKDTRSASFPY